MVLATITIVIVRTMMISTVTLYKFKHQYDDEYVYQRPSILCQCSAPRQGMKFREFLELPSAGSDLTFPSRHFQTFEKGK